MPRTSTTFGLSLWRMRSVERKLPSAGPQPTAGPPPAPIRASTHPPPIGRKSAPRAIEACVRHVTLDTVPRGVPERSCNGDADSALKRHRTMLLRRVLACAARNESTGGAHARRRSRAAAGAYAAYIRPLAARRSRRVVGRRNPPSFGGRLARRAAACLVPDSGRERAAAYVGSDDSRQAGRTLRA